MIAHRAYRSPLKGKTNQDRSLGYTGARVNEPTVEASLEEYPYLSAGKRIEATDLEFEKAKGDTLKHGSLSPRSQGLLAQR